MPPDLPIAGGAKSGVRDHVRWVPLSVSPSLSSVDTDSSCSDASSDSASSFSSFSSDASLGRSPPSPPIHAISLQNPIDAVLHTRENDFMARVFPAAHKVADRIVPVQLDHPVWTLALFDDSVHEGRQRTLYAKGASEKMNLRENVVQLLDLADEEFGCDQVVVVLEKHDEGFSALLHSLLYVGGVVIPPQAGSPLNQASSSYVLVGIDI